MTYEIVLIILLAMEIFVFGAIFGAWFIEKTVYGKGDDTNDKDGE